MAATAEAPTSTGAGLPSTSDAPRKVARATPAPTGARLKLESADDDVMREQLRLRSSSELAPAPAGAASAAAALPQDEDAALRALERARLQTLEDSLTRLHTDSQATQLALAQLQLRLQEAEAQRYANPLVFGLAGLVVLLTAAVVMLLWRQRRAHGAMPPWWDASAAAAAAAALPALPQVTEASVDADVARTSLRRPHEEGTTVVETTASPMMLNQLHAMAHADADDGPSAPVEGTVAERELSVEELIDLEQQAEFFVVLGQEDAAIDLLMSHVRSSGGAIPLPYLKLLEIYRRRGEREAYERIRERFNRRFNAYAPDWQADEAGGRSLTEYLHVIERLQALWAEPARAMQALEASLFRRDPGNTSFDLPAYRELMFLFSVARDLSEREASATESDVDLLLPIDGEAGEQALVRLHPSAKPQAAAPAAVEVDVDITQLGAEFDTPDDRPSRFLTDFSPTSGAMDLTLELPVGKSAA